jgi:hypothetical protein
VEQQSLQNLKPESASTSDGSVKAHYANGKREEKSNDNNGNNVNNDAKKKGNCNYYGYPGHYEYEYRKKVSDQ